MNRKRSFRSLIIGTVIVVSLLIGLCAVLFRVKAIEYIGGTYYEGEELNDIIFGTDTPNALVYTLFGKKKADIAFVQKIDVDVEWPNKMVVTVYEKPIVGYISYMGSNMYFDKDGMVVESSSMLYENVPQIEGIRFKNIVLNSKLEIENMSVFGDILELTQSFDKYELKVDKIYFDAFYNVTLYIDDVKVILGRMENCSERLFELKQMEASLAGLSGTLYLSELTEDRSGLTFKKAGTE